MFFLFTSVPIAAVLGTTNCACCVVLPRHADSLTASVLPASLPSVVFCHKRKQCYCVDRREFWASDTGDIGFYNWRLVFALVRNKFKCAIFLSLAFLFPLSYLPNGPANKAVEGVWEQLATQLKVLNNNFKCRNNDLTSRATSLWQSLIYPSTL